MSFQRTVRVWEAFVSRRVVRVSVLSFELLLLADEALGLFGEAIVVVIRVRCVVLDNC